MVKLWDYEDSNVKVVLSCGKVVAGVVSEYISELDNGEIEHRPPAASIIIGEYELYEDEIASIEIIDTSTAPLAQAV